MQAVVKNPHIEIKTKGKIPSKIINFFEKEYGNNFQIIDEDNELVDVFETEWYKETKKNMIPGDYIRVYRMNAQMTQEELGIKLGNFSRQNVSELEKGKRGISKEVAKKLALIFKKPVDIFL